MGLRIAGGKEWEEIFKPRLAFTPDRIDRAGIERIASYAIASLDCDGRIDSLLPIWLENGVNTIRVGRY